MASRSSGHGTQASIIPIEIKMRIATAEKTGRWMLPFSSIQIAMLAMSHRMIVRRFARYLHRGVLLACPLLAGTAPMLTLSEPAHGQAATPESIVQPAIVDGFDPFEPAATDPDPFEEVQCGAPVDAAEYVHNRPVENPQPVVYQTPFADDPDSDDNHSGDAAKDPCAAVQQKPLQQLGINIALPSGDLPTDQASACWAHINQTGGPMAAARYWPTLCYNWDATCLCHRPLYFEEINLERYGYGCCDCVLQPAASAAHFFATVPALPYCIAAECPCKCVYTLGHYRPGSCPPKRYHWPYCSPLAAAAEAGVLTGLIFAIP